MVRDHRRRRGPHRRGDLLRLGAISQRAPGTRHRRPQRWRRGLSLAPGSLSGPGPFSGSAEQSRQLQSQRHRGAGRQLLSGRGDGGRRGGERVC